MKIAIVFPSGHFYDTPCVPNLAKYLARSGAEVDVFIARNRETPEGVMEIDGLKLHSFPIELSRAKENVALLSVGFGFWLTLKLLRGGYDIVIACGIRGLFVSGVIAPILGLRYAYNSLELYSGARYEHGLGIWFKKLERMFNRRACFSIIQDGKRAALLEVINGIKEQPIGLFPNAPYQYEDKSAACSADIRARFGIEKNSKLVVYSGSLQAKWSGVEQILAVVPKLSEGKLLFLQARSVTGVDLGFDKDDPGFVGKMVISSTPLSVSEYDELVRDATVGLAWYDSNEDNIRYVGLSSGKVAHFLRWGKPVILNRLPFFDEIFEKYKCGILVDQAEDIPAAIDRIEQNYERFSEGAKTAYSQLFDMDSYATKLASQIAEIARTGK